MGSEKDGKFSFGLGEAGKPLSLELATSLLNGKVGFGLKNPIAFQMGAAYTPSAPAPIAPVIASEPQVLVPTARDPEGLNTPKIEMKKPEPRVLLGDAPLTKPLDTPTVQTSTTGKVHGAKKGAAHGF